MNLSTNYILSVFFIYLGISVFFTYLGVQGNRHNSVRIRHTHNTYLREYACSVIKVQWNTLIYLFLFLHQWPVR